VHIPRDHCAEGYAQQKHQRRGTHAEHQRKPPGLFEDALAPGWTQTIRQDPFQRSLVIHSIRLKLSGTPEVLLSTVHIALL